MTVVPGEESYPKLPGPVDWCIAMMRRLIATLAEAGRLPCSRLSRLFGRAARAGALLHLANGWWLDTFIFVVRSQGSSYTHGACFDVDVSGRRAMDESSRPCFEIF